MSSDPYQHLFAPLYALCVEHEQDAPKPDAFRIGSMWRSKQTMRVRVIIDVDGDNVLTRFENGVMSYWVTKDFLERLYSPM
jgi:hypothetical protein